MILRVTWADGEMVDTHALGACAARYESSSLSPPRATLPSGLPRGFVTK